MEMTVDTWLIIVLVYYGFGLLALVSASALDEYAHRGVNALVKELFYTLLVIIVWPIYVAVNAATYLEQRRWKERRRETAATLPPKQQAAARQTPIQPKLP